MTAATQDKDRSITVSVIQFNPQDDDKEANVAKVERLLSIAGQRGSDLCVLPEVFTGTALALGNSSELAEAIPGPTTDRLRAVAQRYGMYIVGSLYEEAAGSIYNTAPVIGRDGSILAAYRKSHLFDPGTRPDLPAYRESDKVKPGHSLRVVEADFGRIGIAICSDIRFPEIFRNHALEGAEIVVLPSAFPARLDHWEFLNRSRAADNQLFMVSSGMVGKLKDSSINFVGRSMIVDPWGVIIAQASDCEMVLTSVVDLSAVKLVRSWWDLNSQRRPELYTALGR
ncbi:MULTISPECIES: carbon-nitrogen hydrolase family protein [Hyphomicrobiales]|jgi:predicted amidohydrolase|uniref:carbon-nitrogen hydrolase family protein n=1 Tax=Methylobacterium sp. CCH7-A2 TaxID=1768789 RepID=UPI0008297D18|nr:MULTISPECIES: carbon-nitrogen hydrolase family protein [Hyphomicrobiales]